MSNPAPLSPKVHNVIVDEEFAGINRALTPEEHLLLKLSIKLDGVRHSLDAWWDGEKWILVDGYNRYEIWRGEGGPEPDVRSVPDRLKSREAVIDWLIDLQLARRNLNPNERKYLEGRRFNGRKSNPLSYLKKGANSSGNSRGTIVVPRAKPGKNRNKSQRVQESKAGRFAAAVDAIGKNVGNKAAEDIRAGAISQKDVIAIAQLPPNEQGAAVARAKLGKQVKDTSLKDDAGEPVPASLRGVFELVPLFDTIIRQFVPGIQTNMRRIAERIKSYRATSADAIAKNLFDLFSSLRPAYVCKPCSGEGCTSCKQRGWRPKAIRS